MSYSFVVPQTAVTRKLGLTPQSVAGSLDRVIDPATGDYLRDTHGVWLHTADSRTVVLIALSTRLNRSAYHPQRGTLVQDRQQEGTLSGMGFVEAETLRVLQGLESEGHISQPSVSTRDDQGRQLRDADGVPIVQTYWRDLASGSPLNATFRPYNPR